MNYFFSIEPTTSAQRKTQKRTSRAATESEQNEEIYVFRAKGILLRETGGKVAFTVTNFRNLNIGYSFRPDLVRLEGIGREEKVDL